MCVYVLVFCGCETTNLEYLPQTKDSASLASSSNIADPQRGLTRLFQTLLSPSSHVTKVVVPGLETPLASLCVSMATSAPATEPFVVPHLESHTSLPTCLLNFHHLLPRPLQSLIEEELLEHLPESWKTAISTFVELTNLDKFTKLWNIRVTFSKKVSMPIQLTECEIPEHEPSGSTGPCCIHYTSPLPTNALSSMSNSFYIISYMFPTK